MRKIMDILKGKCSIMNVANMFAMAMVVYTVTVTCTWAHHQPEVPEAARRFRKF